MDPYLEEPGLWPDVHGRLINIASEFLNARIRPKYVTRIEERVYISDQDDPGREVIAPDVRILRVPTAPSTKQSPPGGVAVVEPAAEVTASVRMTTLLEDDIHESYLQVIDRASREVVTVIEILSPANKVEGSRGRDSYVHKRRQVMNSPSHFVEIDLLRRGAHVTTREQFPPCEYTVHVSRVGLRPAGDIWPIRLHQRLPVIPIPLRGSDPDAPLDLQQVLATAYERAAYDADIDYKREPVPPLPPPLAAWAEERLKSRGLR
jgi:hypothetical protein